MIFKTTLIHRVINLDFSKIMQFMLQTSNFQKMVSFFAEYIPSEILTLPEILFCHVEIIFFEFIWELWGKIKIFEKQVLNPKLV